VAKSVVSAPNQLLKL